MHQSLIVLQKGVAQCFPDDRPLTDPRRLQTKGKAMLLVGRFMEETANFESNAIMKAYKVSSVILQPPYNKWANVILSHKHTIKKYYTVSTI